MQLARESSFWLTFDPTRQKDTAREHPRSENKTFKKKIATGKLFSDHQLGRHVTRMNPLGATAHLDGAGVVLRATHHARGSVEAGGRLEGDGQVVGLRDVLHGGRVGVRLHDGRQLEGQHQGEQLLQDGGTDGVRRKVRRRREKRDSRRLSAAAPRVIFQPWKFTKLTFFFLN